MIDAPTSRLPANHAEQADALFILSQTRAGQPFRPSDWIERMAGLFATFGEDKRLRYSPWVRPAVLDGKRGLWLERGLDCRDPSAYAFIMAFADSHGLAVRPAAPGRLA